jgi:hypothetical protein
MPRTLLTLAIFGAGIALITSCQPTVWAQENKGAEEKPAAKTEKSKVRKALDRIQETKGKNLFEAQNPLAADIRELVLLGKEGVPELIEELDTTQDERMMRCLGFILRAIGDKRAVPSLVRAIPKTCLPPASDYGLKVDDAELMAFMRKHDTDEEDHSPDSFGFGRPIVEIGFALRKLTGQKLGETELMLIFLNGSDHQQRQERQVYQRCAQRWEKWWDANWKKQVDDEAYSKVNLYVRKDLENAKRFPHGPMSKFGEPMEGMILQTAFMPPEEGWGPFGTLVFLDLDTNRTGTIPESLRPAKGQPEKLDEIAAWAAREGFDVMGTQHTIPGEDRPHFVLRSLGLTAWQIKTDLWNDIKDVLAKPELPEFGAPAAGLLSPYDEAKNEYKPKEFATYLFVTREGGCGALFVGAEVTSTAVKFGEPAPPPRETERSNVGVFRGRRLSYLLVEDPAK